MTVINYFVPSRQYIQSISNSNPAVITTTADHGYSAGLYVRLFMPAAAGMEGLDNKQFLITILSDTTFSIPVDSTNLGSFDPTLSSQASQVIPIAEESNTLANAEINNRNIPPENTWIST